MNYTELIDIKADLLCKGLRPTDESKRIKLFQNPFDDPKTGNEGIFITLDNGKPLLKDKEHCSSEIFYELSEYTALKVAEKRLNLQFKIINYQIKYEHK